MEAQQRRLLSIYIGLNQLDPLAPLLFLSVAVGFSGLMRNAERVGLFEGFCFMRKGLVVFYLQYVDYTLSSCRAIVDNI